MMIIVSGVDKVGKTTIIDNIRKEIGYMNIQAIKLKGPKSIKKTENNAKKWSNYCFIIYETILRFNEGLEFDRNKVIMDRLYPDEIVYSEVFRNMSLWDRYDDIDERYSDIGTKFIYIAPPSDFEMYKKRFIEEEDITEWNKVKKLLKCFEEFYEWTKLDKIKITQDTDIKKVVNFILNDNLNRNNKFKRDIRV